MDGRGLPLSVLLTAGQAGDNPLLLPLLAAIRVPRVGPGRPRTRPEHLTADKAYSHPLTRRALLTRRISHSIPERSDQQGHRLARGSGGGRPPAFDRERYRGRNVVERCFARLKQFRALATRYAKRAAYYRSTLLLVATVLWLRSDRQERS